MLNPTNVLLVSVRRVPPRFSVEPEDLKVMPGSDVNLTCVAVGSPMPYVKWRQGAYDLTDEDDIPIGKNVLQLKDVRESKNYTCEASSDLGNIERLVQVLVEGEEAFVRVCPSCVPRLVLEPQTQNASPKMESSPVQFASTRPCLLAMTR